MDKFFIGCSFWFVGYIRTRFSHMHADLYKRAKGLDGIAKITPSNDLDSAAISRV
jgi:hypothetical protein